MNEIQQLQEELLIERNKNLSLRADYSNYRKRMENEVKDAKFLATLNTLDPVLDVFDSFFSALEYAELMDDNDPLKQGLQIIYKEFEKALFELQVDRIDCIGKPFDPNIHDAVAYEESDNVDEGKILKELKCGYRFGEKIIRPSSVVVSSGSNKRYEN